MTTENETQDGQKGKQPVFSVKSSKDVVEKAYELVEKSGLSVKDWFEGAVSAMEIQMFEGTEADQAQDTQQMRYHMKRVEDLFLSQVQKIIELREDFHQKLNEENVRHKGLVDNLQEQKAKLQGQIEQLVKDTEETKKREEVLLERNKTLEEGTNLSSKTIAIIQARNTDLEEEVAAIPKYEEEVKNLRSENYNHLAKITQLEREKERLQSLVTAAEDKYHQTKEEGERKSGEIQRLMNLKMEKVIVESDMKVLEEVQKAKDESSKRERELMNKNEELTRRVHELEITLLEKNSNIQKD